MHNSIAVSRFDSWRALSDRVCHSHLTHRGLAPVGQSPPFPRIMRRARRSGMPTSKKARSSTQPGRRGRLVRDPSRSIGEVETSSSASVADDWREQLRHVGYPAGWKKFEPVWDAIIRAKRASAMLPMLEWFGRHGAASVRPGIEESFDYAELPGSNKLRGHGAGRTGRPGLPRPRIPTMTRFKDAR